MYLNFFVSNLFFRSFFRSTNINSFKRLIFLVIAFSSLFLVWISTTHIHALTDNSLDDDNFCSQCLFSSSLPVFPFIPFYLSSHLLPFFLFFSSYFLLLSFLFLMRHILMRDPPFKVKSFTMLILSNSKLLVWIFRLYLNFEFNKHLVSDYFLIKV